MFILEYMKKDEITPLLIGGMLLVMVVGFFLIRSLLKKAHRKVHIGYSVSYFASYYFLFSAFLERQFQALGIYLHIPPMSHLALFVLTWCISNYCLIKLIFALAEDAKKTDSQRGEET